MRDIGDLMRAVNKYAFLICVCGLKIKVPPDFKKSKLSCPRCRREIQIPFAELAAVTAAVGTAMPEKSKKEHEHTGPQTYVRKGKGWETFSCSCNRLLQISPTFLGSHIMCSDCGRKTEIG